jgi:predicted outer membrane repeat protein
MGRHILPLMLTIYPIINCIIKNNQAHELVGPATGSGGGIYCDRASPTITNGTISQNSSDSGGGIHCSEDEPMISGCVLSQNSVTVGRAGLYASGSSIIVANSTITGNLDLSGLGPGGGGVYLWNYCIAIVTDSSITYNKTDQDEGGISCSYYTSVTLTNCTI